MADKCITLCADHLCIHNSCSGYYGVCALSALSVGAKCGLTRDYVETCPKKEHIPNCIARGPGKIALFDHGRAGNGKSTLDLERTYEIMTSSLVEPVTFTVADIMHAIQKFRELPKPEITPWSQSPFQREYMGIWHFEEEENEK